MSKFNHKIKILISSFSYILLAGLTDATFFTVTLILLLSNGGCLVAFVETNTKFIFRSHCCQTEITKNSLLDDTRVVHSISNVFIFKLLLCFIELRWVLIGVTNLNAELANFRSTHMEFDNWKDSSKHSGLPNFQTSKLWASFMVLGHISD